MNPKTIADIDPYECKRDNFIKYPEKDRRSMINVYKNYIRNLEVEVDNDKRFQQLLPHDITQHDINSNKSLRTNLKKIEWLKKSRQNSPLPQNPLNHANYVSAMKNAFLASSLANACSYQPVNPNEAFARIFDDVDSQVYKDDWEVDCPTTRFSSENWLLIPEDRSKLLQKKIRPKIDDDPDWIGSESTAVANEDIKRVTRKSKIQNCIDSSRIIIDPEFKEPEVHVDIETAANKKYDNCPFESLSLIFHSPNDFSQPAKFKNKRGRPRKVCQGDYSSNQIKDEPDSISNISLDNGIKRKRGRPKGAKNNKLKFEYQDELSWEDIQTIEKLNKMSVQASARFLL